MVYDPKVDRTLWSQEVFITNPMGKAYDKSKLVVSVKSYDGGQPKVEIKQLQYGRDKEGQYGPMRRVSRGVLTKLLPVLKEALERM